MTDFDGLFPQKIPIAAVLGDSHAALFANGCFAEGMTKATFGTGTSVMMNAGASRPKQVPDGLVESVSWGRGGEVFYALEGNINYSGALIKWLVNDLELIQTSRESGQFAMQVKDTGGVYFVPAFSGLGAPYWDNDARAMICGITAATKKRILYVRRRKRLPIRFGISPNSLHFAEKLLGFCAWMAVRRMTNSSCSSYQI